MKTNEPCQHSDAESAAPERDLVSVYFREISAKPRLTQDDEAELSRRIQCGERVMQRALLRLPTSALGPDAPDVENLDHVRALNTRLRGHVEQLRSAVVPCARETPRVRVDELERAIRELDRGLQLVTDAQRALVEGHLRLVVYIAKKHQRRGVAFLDLIQEGNIGLMRAAQKYDYRLGFRFATYAVWWIRQAVQRVIANQSRPIRLPVHTHVQIIAVERVRQSLTQALGRAPTVDEIAVALDVSPDDVRVLHGIPVSPVSLDEPSLNLDFCCVGDTVEDARALPPFEFAARRERACRVREALAKLPEQEARVVRLRFGLDEPSARTLADVGRLFHVSRERVRQIEQCALSKLRKASQAHGLRDLAE